MTPEETLWRIETLLREMYQADQDHGIDSERWTSAYIALAGLLNFRLADD